MRSILASIIAAAITLGIGCGPGDDKPPAGDDTCVAAAVVTLQRSATQATSTTAALSSSCAINDAPTALFAFTPQLSGSYRFIARNDRQIPIFGSIWSTSTPCGEAEQCEATSELVLYDLVAGEVVYIGTSAEQANIVLNVIPVTIIETGGACDNAERVCAPDESCTNNRCVGPRPSTVCDDAIDIGDGFEGLLSLGEGALPPSFCGDRSSITAVVRWTAPSTGWFAVYAEDDAERISIHRESCDNDELRCSTGLVYTQLPVVAGEVFYFAIEGATNEIPLRIEMLVPRVIGEACNTFTDWCVDSDCIDDFAREFDDDGGEYWAPRCAVVEDAGRCAAPIDVALDEVVVVRPDRTRIFESTCINDSDFGKAVFTFTAPHDLVLDIEQESLLGFDDAEVTRDGCGGEPLRDRCTTAPVSLRAGETAIVQYRNTAHTWATTVGFGSRAVARFAPKAVTPLGVGDPCDPTSTENGWCAFDTICVQNVCMQEAP